jgi:hypothetical protein
LIELVRWECNPTIDYACPGCGAARSGAPLIRDRHGLERSTQVGFTRLAHIGAPISGKPEIGVCRKTGKYRDRTNQRGARVFGSLILRRREAPSRRMRRSIPLPSCFETHRSAVRQWKHLHSCRAAMLLSMRAGGRSAFWPNEPSDHFRQTKPNLIRVVPARGTPRRSRRGDPVAGDPGSLAGVHGSGSRCARPGRQLDHAKDQPSLYEMTAGSVPLFSDCYLQWVLQLARVGL